MRRGRLNRRTAGGWALGAGSGGGYLVVGGYWVPAQGREEVVGALTLTDRRGEPERGGLVAKCPSLAKEKGASVDAPFVHDGIGFEPIR